MSYRYWDLFHDYVWITADVTSLYTVILHDLAIALAFIWFLDTYSDHLKDFMISVTMFVLKYLSTSWLSYIMFLLKHNDFKFDMQFYLQISGVAMSAKFSPVLAIIFIAWWQNVYIFHEENPFYSSLVWYGRYILDIFLIWRSDAATIPDLSTYFKTNNFGVRFMFN